MRLKNNITHMINDFQSCGPNKTIINNAQNLKSIIDYIDQNDQNYAIISLDQEKAFDRIEHNFLKIVLKKFNFPSNFINWFNIIYTDIESKVLVNGTFTPNFKILRSVRQGCSLSMFLYVLGLEPLIFKINANTLIQGIKLPNLHKQIKSLQHADDTIVIIKNTNSYNKLQEETKDYSKNSGSKINNDKTEILAFGNWDQLKMQISDALFKTNIKVYGIIYGENEIKENFEPKIQKIKQRTHKWNKHHFNILERIIILKTYIFSLLQYTMLFIELPQNYTKMINSIIFQFLWNGTDKNKRDTMYQDIKKGGLSVPSITHKQESITIQTLRKIEGNLNQPWAALYIYWFGLNLRFYCPNFASNNYIHNIENFYEKEYIKRTILKYRLNEPIWKTSNLKNIYNMTVDSINNTTTISLKYPTSDWDLIWRNISQYTNYKDKITIFKYIHKILPTGEYLKKINCIAEIPRCADCWLGPNTFKHIFENCTAHNVERTELITTLNRIDPNITINSTLIQTGNNTHNIPISEMTLQNKICKTIFKYILQIWAKTTKIKLKFHFKDFCT